MNRLKNGYLILNQLEGKMNKFLIRPKFTDWVEIIRNEDERLIERKIADSELIYRLLEAIQKDQKK